MTIHNDYGVYDPHSEQKEWGRAPLRILVPTVLFMLSITASIHLIDDLENQTEKEFVFGWLSSELHMRASVSGPSTSV